jgi:TRAP-type C4-dicarboxylate transport system substrate-binding protein
VQEYLSLTGHVYTPAYVVVSPSRWGALPAEVWAVLEEEAQAVQAFVHETAERHDVELLGQISATGVEVSTPEREAFAAASRAVYEEYGATVPSGNDLIRRAISAGSR